MKKIALILAFGAYAAFGEAVPYDPAVHGNPIVVTGDAVVEIDGGGATVDGGGVQLHGRIRQNAIKAA